MTQEPDANRDGEFLARLERGLSTVQAWDSAANVSTIQKIREELPWDELRNENGKYSQWVKDVRLFNKNNNHHDPNLQFVQRLARYFQRDVMKWMNSPDCETCQTNTTMNYVETRAPYTPEERLGEASRVEVHKCATCQSQAEFPRYNACSKLQETKRGRCGEYANLFGCYCRAVGLDVRYVSDWTDHVWTEVRGLDGQWYMVDSCEGVVNEPSMYEKGWGKKLNVVVAFGNYSVVDVTPRYTRQFQSKDMQERRRLVTTSEIALEQIIFQVNQTLQQKGPRVNLEKTAILSQKALQTLQANLQKEVQELETQKMRTTWDIPTYEHGRISGSTAWKMARQETGSNNKTEQPTDVTTTANTTTTTAAAAKADDDKDISACVAIMVEPPFSAPSFASLGPDNNNNICKTTTITVNPWAPHASQFIVWNGTMSCVGGSGGGTIPANGPYLVAAVWAPPEYGCALLHSRVFSHCTDLMAFVDTLPRHVILAMTGRLLANVPTNGDNKDKDKEHEKASLLSDSSSPLLRLGGFIRHDMLLNSPSSKTDNELEAHGDSIVYVGQVDAHPSWAVCGQARDFPQGCQLQLLSTLTNQSDDGNSNTSTICLAQYQGIVPAGIVGRLPDSVLPLHQQESATLAEKRALFWNNPLDGVCGFVTKKGAPVYLVGALACPLSTVGRGTDDANDDSIWTTCLKLPRALVPPKFIVDKENLNKLESSKGLVVQKVELTGGVTAGQLAYQVPVNLDFFHSQIGTKLVTSIKSSTGDRVRLPTEDVLANARLVGIYFSAHWCGPCRSFTPLLIEAYETWKEHLPSHGLEMVFCSSDRDAISYEQYHNSMPWPAIPFENLATHKHVLSSVYGIRGIPSLVILDAVSGEVVVSAQQSRNEIMLATRGGSVGLENLLNDWLNRAPPLTLELLQMLEASCKDHIAAAPATSDSKQEHHDEKVQSEDISAPPAYLVTASGLPSLPLPAGPHDALFHLVSPPAETALSEDALRKLLGNDQKVIASFLETILKYVSNCRASPWVVKYRHFRVGNKVVDKGITSLPHALTVLQQMFGFSVTFEDDDFILSIPVARDLDLLHSKLSAFGD